MDRECAKCGEFLSLQDGREWSSEEDDTYCWECLAILLDESREAVSRAEAEITQLKKADRVDLGALATTIADTMWATNDEQWMTISGFTQAILNILRTHVPAPAKEPKLGT